MNNFEKVVEDNKLYLKVTTIDVEGNMSINYKICSSDQEFDAVRDNLITGMESKATEVSKELERLNAMSLDLKTELDILKKI